MTSSNNIDLISWSDEQEDSLRALFDTFDINGNGMLDLPELKEMLTLVQQTTEAEENNEVFGEGEKVLLNAAIETMTTFSITTGVTFSEFIHFYNCLQELGLELDKIRNKEDETATDDIIDDITELAVDNATAMNDNNDSDNNNNFPTGARFQRTASERKRWQAMVQNRRNILHKQILKRETTHKDLVVISNNSNNYKTSAKRDEIDYITITDGADALRHTHNAHYKIDLNDEIVAALKEHFDDIQEEGIISLERSNFAKLLVDNRDLTAIFAFYKFAYNDIALNKYLEFKFAAIEKQKKLNKKRENRHEYLLARAASYERFLNERKTILEETRKNKKKLKKIVVDDEDEKKEVIKKTQPKNKPRWTLLYEKGLKKIQALRAFETKK